MAAQVNPVAARPAFEGVGDIINAIRLARDIFGKNPEDERYNKQLDIAERSLGLQTAQEQSKYVAMPHEQAKAEGYGPALLPETQRGLGLPALDGQGYFSRAERDVEMRRIQAESLAEKAERKENEKLKQQLTKEFRKEYDSNDSIKAVRNTLLGFKRIESGIKSPDKGGASDLVLINGFAKILDPIGSVRPSEFESAQEAMPFLNRYGYNFVADKLATGGRLDETTRMQMYREAQRLTLGQLEVEETYANSLQTVLDKYKIEKDDVFDLSMDVWRDKIKSELESSGQMPLGLNQNQQTVEKKPSMLNMFEQKAQADTPFDPVSFLRK